MVVKQLFQNIAPGIIHSSYQRGLAGKKKLFRRYISEERANVEGDEFK